MRSAITTRAPPAWRRRAVAAPSPDAPPITSAPAPSILIAAAGYRDRRGKRPAPVAYPVRIPAPAHAISKERIADRLAEARRRILTLVAPLDDEQLNRVYSPILSPLAWDLGHIANFEELWLVQTVGGREPLDGDLGRLYDAIENPRVTRNELPILRGDRLRSYMEEVRGRALEVLDEVDLDDDGDRLLAGGFVYEMLLAHEHQHGETILQLLQMVERYEPLERDPAPASEPVPDGPEMVSVDGGEVEVGAGPGGFAYDNERPRHTVEVEPFRIDRIPVTNGAFAEFVVETGAEAPMYWEPAGDGAWARATMGLTEEVDPRLPVIHVDHGQAEAFARWAGKRLPSELEWEAAAAGARADRANLDQLAFGTAPGRRLLRCRLRRGGGADAGRRLGVDSV